MPRDLDEDFLRWWAKGLEKNGIDLDEKLVRISAHPPSTPTSEVYLYHVYSYREYFAAVRRRQYWPVVSYEFAYRRCWQSVLENEVNSGYEVIPPWKRPEKPKKSSIKKPKKKSGNKRRNKA